MDDKWMVDVDEWIHGYLDDALNLLQTHDPRLLVLAGQSLQQGLAQLAGGHHLRRRHQSGLRREGEGGQGVKERNGVRMVE